MTTQKLKKCLVSKEQANLILDQVRVGVLYPTHIINHALTITGDLNGQQLQKNKLQNNIGGIQNNGIWCLHRETDSKDVYETWILCLHIGHNCDFIRYVCVEAMKWIDLKTLLKIAMMELQNTKSKTHTRLKVDITNHKCNHFAKKLNI